MFIDPQQVNVNLGTVYDWLKLLGYLGLGVTAIWKLSRFATEVHEDTREFVADIRQFLKESRDFMGKMGQFANIVETNHLSHIEDALISIEQSLRDAPLARVVKEESEETR